MTNATKKQNRILLGTLVLLCAALITLAAMTSTAQKRAKAREERNDPLPESRVSEAEKAPHAGAAAQRPPRGFEYRGTTLPITRKEVQLYDCTSFL